ncbi:phosphohexomutase domain-containing protein [Devosia sp. A449]
MIAFGTSGLRGDAAFLTRELCQSYMEAFTALVGEAGCIAIGRDRRASSSRIMKDCSEALADLGWTVINVGVLPTPALANFATPRGMPAIMITASHNPASHNGMKFFTRNGELNKQEEAWLQLRLASIEPKTDFPDQDFVVPEEIAEASLGYVSRYTTFFTGLDLTGQRIGIDHHSAAGTALLQSILEALGANCLPVRTSAAFIAIDTEALDAEYLDAAKHWIESMELDALVSTDGDGDRPLVFGEDGAQIQGDILGVAASCFLGVSTLVTPLTTSALVDRCGLFSKIHRTKVGSPYVIEGMLQEISNGKHPVVGFEGNGGYLCTSLRREDATLPELLTRDAVLPILAFLGFCGGRPLSKAIEAFPSRFKNTALIPNTTRVNAERVLALIAGDRAIRANMHGSFEEPKEISLLDGVRIADRLGNIIHFRQSGNAEELRIYVESDNKQDAADLLEKAAETATTLLADI